MAENLFSKYRPTSINDIFGHDKVKQEFKKRIEEKNLPKCILLTGRSGTGKNCFEKIISRSILCTNPVNGVPCGECTPCKTVIEEKISNYYYLFNASNIGIDEMRSIEELASKKNLSTIKDKVIVVNELQELGSNQKALKALLMVLEKPLDHVYFILLAMDESKIPSALKNRCVHYKLKDLSYEEIAKNLYNICIKENITVDTKEKADTLITIAQNSDGSMRTAISYLERCIYSDIWDSKAIIDELGIVSNEGLITIINHLLTGNVKLFESDVNKDILDRVRWILNVLYKAKAGVELNAYQKSFIKGIVNVDMSALSNVISRLNDLTMLTYITQEMIDFTLIDIIMKNKNAYIIENKDSVIEKPVANREWVRRQ